MLPEPGCRHSYFHRTAQGAAGEPPPGLGPPAPYACQGCLGKLQRLLPVLSMWFRQSQAQLGWVELCLPRERRQAFTPPLIKRLIILLLGPEIQRHCGSYSSFGTRVDRWLSLLNDLGFSSCKEQNLYPANGNKSSFLKSIQSIAYRAKVRVKRQTLRRVCRTTGWVLAE